MTKNTIIKIIISILLFILIFSVLSQTVFASKFDIGTKFQGTSDKSNASNNVRSIFGAIINIIQVFGAGLAIIMLVILGIQYFWVTPTGKAEFLKKMRVYILGAIIIFAATGLLQIVKNFVNKNINEKVLK